MDMIGEGDLDRDASAAAGVRALLASGRVQPARRAAETLPDPLGAPHTIAEVLDEMRGER